MKLAVSRLHGTHNDFLVTVVAPDAAAPDADTARRVCDRAHSGGGADGLIALLPATNDADCAMELRNADGELAEMSGNGIRCLAWVAVRAGLARGNQLVVETAAGLRTLTLTIDPTSGEMLRASVDMGPAAFPLRPFLSPVIRSIIWPSTLMASPTKAPRALWETRTGQFW